MLLILLFASIFPVSSAFRPEPELAFESAVEDADLAKMLEWMQVNLGETKIL